MYRKDNESWLKHADFIALDLLCLQLAYILAYGQRGYGFNPYGPVLYRSMAFVFFMADMMVILAYGTMRNVLKRGMYRNLAVTLNHTAMVVALSVLYLFLSHRGQDFSRQVYIVTIVLYLVLAYVTRELWKRRLHKEMEDGGGQKLMIITSQSEVNRVITNLMENNYARYDLVGIALVDADWVGCEVQGVPVVATGLNAAEYVCQQWIDEVFVIVSEFLPYPKELMHQLAETGVTIHLNLAKMNDGSINNQFIEKVGNYTVITRSMNYASTGELLMKRCLDILGGLVGCFFTGIIFLFVAPAIYIASPGPIFFSQERIGKNGKKFKMYKFRSMYLDAEERKAELMEENKLGDGKMFKMDFDPRVIGNRELPDGTRKTGVGDFLRRTSLDEFPQFWNVLKGDMSLVGTRPPLESETSLYELHHHARLAIKPGITGVWQVNGRSDITDFEEVVRLDKEYIENWDISMDFKVLLKTVKVLLKKDGAV